MRHVHGSVTNTSTMRMSDAKRTCELISLLNQPTASHKGALHRKRYRPHFPANHSISVVGPVSALRKREIGAIVDVMPVAMASVCLKVLARANQPSIDEGLLVARVAMVSMGIDHPHASTIDLRK